MPALIRGGGESTRHPEDGPTGPRSAEASMSASGEYIPRIRTIVYAPAVTDPPMPVACPHCGGPISGPMTPVPEPRESAELPVVEDLPDADEVRIPVARVLQSVLEAIDGTRPLEQLRAVLAPSALRYARASLTAKRPMRASRMLSLRVCRPTQHAAEVTAVVRIEQRIRAMAAGSRPARSGCAAFYADPVSARVDKCGPVDEPRRTWREVGHDARMRTDRQPEAMEPMRWEQCVNCSPASPPSGAWTSSPRRPPSPPLFPSSSRRWSA